MTVWVNGRARALASAVTLEALVAEVAPWRRGVAVALNGEVVRRDDWSATAVAEGDRVEVLAAVQGG